MRKRATATAKTQPAWIALAAGEVADCWEEIDLAGAVAGTSAQDPEADRAEIVRRVSEIIGRHLEGRAG